MTEPWDFCPSSAAEFPNDNPALHRGVSWLCLSIGGPPKPVARPGVKAPPPERPAQLSPPAAAEPAPLPQPPVFSISAPPEFEPDFAAFEIVGFEPDVAWTLEQWLAAGHATDGPLNEAPRDEATTLAAVEAPIEAVAAQPVVLAEAVSAAPLPPPVVLAPLALEPIDEPAAESPLALESVETDPANAADGFVVAEAPPEDPAMTVVAMDAADAPREPDAYDAFVQALVAVALDSGATRAAAAVPAVLDASGNLGALSSELRDGLAAARILESAGGAARAAAFADMAAAWRRVLRGETKDFGACGTTTLDGWGVDLLKALGVGGDVKRALRKRGVAAFGMRFAA